MKQAIIAKAQAAQLNGQTTGQVIDVYVQGEQVGFNGHTRICTQDIRCAKTGEFIRDHINAEEAQGMEILRSYIGQRVKMHVTWKVYKDGTEICFKQINNIKD